MEAAEAYEQKKKRLIAQYKLFRETNAEIGLGKNTSNLFRTRTTKKRKLDVRSFNAVITVDTKTRRAVVEGMVTFDAFTQATLKKGMLPAVVPELKTITVGGAVSGVGIESSSFRFGLVHETIEEMDILTGEGFVVTASRTNKYKDLFYGIANSYGTLGYILRLTVKLISAPAYVKITHTKYTEAETYMEAVRKACKDKANAYVDGTVFGPEKMYLTQGKFVQHAPYHSRYTYKKMYFVSIMEKTQDYLTTYDYIWRWDKDWFWCSKNFGMHNLAVRLTAGLFLRGSKQYWKIMALNSRFRVTERIRAITRAPQKESVIQDVQIPINKGATFIEFFLKNIPITPLWICPTQPQRTPHYPLYELDTNSLYINFGFWDVTDLPQGKKDGYYNKQVEEMVEKLDGQKSLYSTAYYDEKAFWKRYNKRAYNTLKAKYDPHKAFLTLYEKTVKRK